MPEIEISLTQQWLAIIQIRNSYIINISKKQRFLNYCLFLNNSLKVLARPKVTFKTVVNSNARSVSYCKDFGIGRKPKSKVPPCSRLLCTVPCCDSGFGLVSSLASAFGFDLRAAVAAGAAAVPLLPVLVLSRLMGAGCSSRTVSRRKSNSGSTQAPPAARSHSFFPI